MRPVVFALCAVALVFATSGCATMMRGSHQELNFLTDPPGATILILPLGENVETPATVNLRRNRAYTLFVEPKGHEPYRVYLNPERDPAATWPLVGNVLLGGIVGYAIDMNVRAHLHLVPYPRGLVTEIELDADGDPVRPVSNPSTDRGEAGSAKTD